MSEDSAAMNRFDLVTGGGYFSTGVGGPLTGKGGNLLGIDDPLPNREAAHSETQRESLWGWYTTVFDTRRAPNARTLLIQTRWHDDDLSGRILNSKDAKNWTVLSLPAINEQGEALWPEAYPINELLDWKEKMGRDFEALYQQSPVPMEGSLFKRKWFKTFQTPPDKFTRVIQFMDCAQKVGVTNDWSVCLTVGESENAYYILDVWRQRVEAPDLERATISNALKWNPTALVIEDKSSGSSLIQSLRQKTRLPVIAYDPKARDKIVRASAATPLVESGRVFVPASAPWVEDFIVECERFPNAKHDDQVDTLSMLAEFVQTRQTPTYRIRRL
jgi:predicted phage terminase large subunit-like protein